MWRLVECGQWNAEGLGLGTRGFRGGYAQHPEPRRHLDAKRLDEARSGRAGAKAEPHSVADEVERAQRGTFLEQRGIAMFHRTLPFWDEVGHSLAKPRMRYGWGGLPRSMR